MWRDRQFVLLGPHTGELLAHGLLTPEQVHQLPHALDALYARRATDLLLLTDAFAIPEALLDVPAAFPDFIDRYTALAPTAGGHP
ncbi:hypothetical protein BEK98_37430 [Streptomyces diastatochromogenes]|uniref:Acyl-CoA oxidase C-terminal domain-containing protein n=1 Tax=Streptomyces diastatochromogenes TaxID=42236 RepID=A0A233S215_STRDA|nr:hypothetical protein BEK98_37430 [Streptomyces diastatochromogenes]